MISWKFSSEEDCHISEKESSPELDLNRPLISAEELMDMWRKSDCPKFLKTSKNVQTKPCQLIFMISTRYYEHQMKVLTKHFSFFCFFTFVFFRILALFLKKCNDSLPFYHNICHTQESNQTPSSNFVKRGL